MFIYVYTKIIINRHEENALVFHQLVSQEQIQLWYETQATLSYLLSETFVSKISILLSILRISEHLLRFAGNNSTCDTNKRVKTQENKEMTCDASLIPFCHLCKCISHA